MLVGSDLVATLDGVREGVLVVSAVGRFARGARTMPVDDVGLALALTTPSPLEAKLAIDGDVGHGGCRGLASQSRSRARRVDAV